MVVRIGLSTRVTFPKGAGKAKPELARIVLTAAGKQQQGKVGPLRLLGERLRQEGDIGFVQRFIGDECGPSAFLESMNQRRNVATH